MSVKEIIYIKKENATDTKFQWLKNARFVEIPYTYHAPNQNKPIEFFSNSDGAYACKTGLME